jgi:hypothetical protein
MEKKQVTRLFYLCMLYDSNKMIWALGGLGRMMIVVTAEAMLMVLP